MPTTNQIADYLFKKSLGTSFTKTDAPSDIGEGFKFFNEPLAGRQAIHSSQIWTESEEIPESAPNSLVSHGQIDGVVELVSGFQLSPVPNALHAFSGTGLLDSIPFNYGDGQSYAHEVLNSAGQRIALGNQDWFIDGDVGVIVFSEGVGNLVSQTNPPTIKCYRYVGEKGVGKSEERNLGAPDDGIYGNAGGIAGITVGDKPENAFDKVEVILEKLAPPKPLDINQVNLDLQGPAYQAYKQDTNTLYQNVIASNNISARTSNVFYDGENGILQGFYNQSLIGEKVLTTANDQGVYSSLEILSDQDFHLGTAGKEGFWFALDAEVSQQNAPDASSFELKISHSLGDSEKSTQVSGEIGVPIRGSSTSINSNYNISLNTRQMDGINIATTSSVFKIEDLEVDGVIGSFYGHNLASATLNGHGSSSFTKNDIETLDGVVSSGPPKYSEQVGFADKNISIYNNNTNLSTYSVTSKDYRGVSVTSQNFSITPNVFLDSSNTPSSRVKSGSGGNFPSAGSYGSSYDNSISLKSSGNEELQFSRSYFQFPSQDFSVYLSNTENYSTGVTAGLQNGYRWATFDMGNISKKTVTFNITGAQNFTADVSKVISNVQIYIKVEGQTGWLNANSPYPGVGNPVNDGDSALVGSASSATTRAVTFGTVNTSGKLYIRIGLTNSNKKFQNIQLT